VKGGRRGNCGRLPHCDRADRGRKLVGLTPFEKLRRTPGHPKFDIESLLWYKKVIKSPSSESPVDEDERALLLELAPLKEKNGEGGEK